MLKKLRRDKVVKTAGIQKKMALKFVNLSKKPVEICSEEKKSLGRFIFAKTFISTGDFEPSFPMEKYFFIFILLDTLIHTYYTYLLPLFNFMTTTRLETLKQAIHTYYTYRMYRKYYLYIQYILPIHTYNTYAQYVSLEKK